MGNRAESVFVLAHRVEQLVRDRLSRDVIPAEEATLTSMVLSPRATIGLTPEQKRQLAELEHPPVTTA